jgi:GNAT superfamily N-acetyltransferase
MSNVQLIRVSLEDRALVDRFIRVPWYVNREVYPNDKWVPPLMMDRRDYLDEHKNPFFDHAEAAFWVAHRDGKDIGRIAAVEDADYALRHGERVGYFGMFECADDEDVARELLERAEEWLRERGCVSVRGPMDLSMNYTCGILVEGFEHKPGVSMPWNPPFYARIVEAAGFEKAKDLYQWGIELSDPIPERVVRISEKIQKREGIEIRQFDFDNWDRDVAITLELLNDAWKENWGFVPMREKEYRHFAKDLKMVLRPELGLIAEVDGEPIAFAATIVDVNPVLRKIDGKLFPFGAIRLGWEVMVKKSIDRGRLVLLGIKERYRRRGIDSLLFVKTFQNSAKIGLTGGQIGWTLEDNVLVNRAIEAFGCKRKFVYRIYEKSLQ